ncbi:hypothetical protein GGI24_001506 [Coemansia furcata]|nr:hypothetical protein GGI24_001506 [Coemansia furcata]
MRDISRSGGGGNREMHRARRPEFRNLSNSSRAARDSEQPWRKRFREQCMDRLNEARDQSFMQRRQQVLSGDDEAMSEDEELNEKEMCNIIQQEWIRFKADMERLSLEYGDFDDSIIEDIEDDLDMQARECADWEEYEQRLLEAEMMEAEMVEAELADVYMEGLEELDIDDEGLL